MRFVAYLILVSFIVSSCTNAQEKKLELTEAKPEPNSSQSNLPAINVIVLSEELFLSYPDTSMGSAEMHHIRELGGVVNGMREVHGDEFMVVIKSPERTNPSVTVNVVEKMNALKVKRYTVSKLLPKEKTLLYSPTATKPPAPVEVKTPEAVKSRQIDSDNSFVIEIRKDETVWYQYRSPTARMAPQPVGEPVTPKLSSVIDDYNSNQPGLVYYIKGDKNATYPVFEKVVNALKANNIYKYILITDEN